MDKDRIWQELLDLDDQLVGTTAHRSNWPRSIIVKRDSRAALRLYSREPPHDLPLPALSADEVDRLIMRLAAVRTHMKPRPPLKWPEAVPITITEGVRARVWRHEELGVMLDIRTDGLGWVSLPLPPERVRELQRDLEETCGEAELRPRSLREVRRRRL